MSGATFFQTTAEQITRLEAAQLVELLRRLIIADMTKAGIPLRCGRVPAQINIPDGGEDGRVDWAGEPNETDFLPSRFCIFQCKRSDRGPASLAKEVRAKGNPESLNDAVKDALDRSGSYIVVTGTALTGQKIQKRIEAIRVSVAKAGGESAQRVSIDIYDANTLTTWANTHPAVALWLNETLNRVSLEGLQTHQSWAKSPEIASGTFVDDDQPRFRLPNEKEGTSFKTATEAITGFLSEGQKALRIVGPSGYGKSRFAYELFSMDHGQENRLDAQSVIFAQHEDVKDRLGALALELSDCGAPSILVIDDCPDEIHRDLLSKARRVGSALRIITTDVETESQHAQHNMVVRLEPAPDEMIETIIRGVGSQIASHDIHFIRDLAQGFPRMAIFAAEAVRDQADPIRSIDHLVERILWGRQAPNQEAIRALQLASLFGVIGIEREAKRESDILAKFDGVSAADLARRLLGFQDRGIVVRKGDYLEIQPWPLATRLGARRLASEPKDWLWDLFSTSAYAMKLRMLRQLRWLDEVPQIRALAGTILHEKVSSFEVLNTDPGAKYLDLLVHLDPDATMAALERLLGDCTTEELQHLVDGRDRVVFALHKLVFRRDSFVSAATLLRRLGTAENRQWGNNARKTFKNLYHLHLSGTEAEPALRLQVLDQGLQSDDPEEQALCVDALKHMLHMGNFSRSGGHERIGSKPPLKDWHPQIWGDNFDFHRAGLSRLHDIACSDNDPLADQARAHIASNIRGLLSIAGIFEDVRKTLLDIVERKGFWPEAPMGVSRWLFYDREDASPDYAAKVRALYDELLSDDPAELMAFYARGWPPDLNDPDRTDDDKQRDYGERQALDLIGNILANDALLKRTLDLVTRAELHGIFSVARHLAERHDDPEELMKAALDAIDGLPAKQIEYRFFAGLIAGANLVSREAALACLALALDNPAFEGRLANMISEVRLDAETLLLPIDLMEQGKLRLELVPLSYGRGLDHLDTAAIAPLIEALTAHSAEGAWAALEILHMYQHGRQELAPEIASWFKDILLCPSLFHVQSIGQMGEYRFKEAVTLLHQYGYLDKTFAVRLTRNILTLATEVDHGIKLDMERASKSVLKCLIAEYQEEVWDCIHPLLNRINDSSIRYHRIQFLFETGDKECLKGETETGLLNNFSDKTYLPWLRENPKERLPIVLGWVSLTQFGESGLLQWHPALERLVNEFAKHPDDLSVIQQRFDPSAWWGSLADQLEPYLPLLQEWRNHPNDAVRRWSSQAHEDLERRIDEERRRDANQDVEWI